MWNSEHGQGYVLLLRALGMTSVRSATRSQVAAQHGRSSFRRAVVRDKAGVFGSKLLQQGHHCDMADTAGIGRRIGEGSTILKFGQQVVDRLDWRGRSNDDDKRFGRCGQTDVAEIIHRIGEVKKPVLIGRLRTARNLISISSAGRCFSGTDDLAGSGDIHDNNRFPSQADRPVSGGNVGCRSRPAGTINSRFLAEILPATACLPLLWQADAAGAHNLLRQAPPRP